MKRYGIRRFMPGKILLLASDYMISSWIQGGWCLLPLIDQKVGVQDAVIKQVLSASVPPKLPMMEDEVEG